MKMTTKKATVVVGASLACLALLAGCGTTDGTTSDPTTASTDAATSPATDAATTAPTDGATAGSDADRFTAQDQEVAATYPVRQPAGTFSGAENTTLTIPGSTVAGPGSIVLLLNCTGTAEYSITVQQQHPNTVGANCGDAGQSVAAVPLDDPAGAQTLDVRIPEGSDYWLSTYYIQNK